MTQEKEALKLALEALEREARGYAVHDELQIPRSMRDAIVAIKEVLAQPEQITPSAYSNTHQPEPPPECQMDSYGDGSVYRGQRSRDSVVKTITLAQPEQEPVVGTKTWFEDGKVVTQYLYPSDIYTTPPQPEQEPCDMGKMCIGCSPRNADGSCPDAPRKPLTDEHIGVIAIKSQDGISPHDDTLRFARAIEAAHGIKE